VWTPTPASHVLDALARPKEESWRHLLGQARAEEGCEGEIPNCATRDHCLYVCRLLTQHPQHLAAHDGGLRVSNAVRCEWMPCGRLFGRCTLTGVAGFIRPLGGPNGVYAAPTADGKVQHSCGTSRGDA